MQVTFFIFLSHERCLLRYVEDVLIHSPRNCPSSGIERGTQARAVSQARPSSPAKAKGGVNRTAADARLGKPAVWQLKQESNLFDIHFVAPRMSENYRYIGQPLD